MNKGRFKYTLNLFANFGPGACSRSVRRCSFLRKIFYRILFPENILIHYKLDSAISIGAKPSLHIELKIAKSKNLI